MHTEHNVIDIIFQNILVEFHSSGTIGGDVDPTDFIFGML
jgi:hypothetical protein